MLSINTNLSSLITQNSLKNSTSILNQAVERMTTGYKINHAKDNAANYSISTNMTTKIGAYMVAEDNVLQGLDMVSTASESLSLIEDKLMRLRALATQASNGSYGDQSKEAINAEASALVYEINRTYATSEYNGLKVFKGTPKIEIPDGIGTTGNVGVQTASSYSMRAADYGDFIDNPYTYTDEEIAAMKTITQAISESSLQSGGEYSISTKEELVALADYVNTGNDTTGMTFVLGADIDLSSISNWTPIGDYSTNSNYQFKGTFDGNGHVIKNLTIDNETKEYQGLFGRTALNVIIKNVGLENASVKGNSNVGGLAGRGSIIFNSYATGAVSGTERVGGLAGSLFGGTQNCYSTGNVSGTELVGGLVGSTNTSLIDNSYATGAVSGTSYVGGLVGYSNSSSSSISNSYATGAVSGTSSVGGLAGSSFSSISNSYATGAVSGTSYVGGLVGDSFTDSSISNSYATGAVSGTSYVGGLVGNSRSSSISNSYATGAVSGTSSVGGLAGSSSSSSSSISNSYATGAVSGTSYVGGLIGKNYQTSGTVNITNCHSYSTVLGNDINSTGSLIGGAVVTTNNSTFGTINISGCKALSQDINTIGGSYFYASSTYTLLDTYDMSAMLAGISLYTPEVTSLTLQVGANAPSSNQIAFDRAFDLENLDSLYQIGIDTTTDHLSIIDNLLEQISAKQTEYGAVQNRLESALEEISTQYENLVSSRSTIRDADIAEVSSHYIQQQILQQASATLMSTANQSPAIALQLI